MYPFLLRYPWQWPLTQAQPTVSDPKSRLSTRVEVFLGLLLTP